MSYHMSTIIGRRRVNVRPIKGMAPLHKLQVHTAPSLSPRMRFSPLVAVALSTALIGGAKAAFTGQ